MALSILIVPSLAAAGVSTADYVRLHVVAADDGPDAQALKLKVRDAVLGAARDLLADASDADEAWEIVNENLDVLESAARSVIDDAACLAGVFPFPDRTYGDTFVPAGNYRALRVVIGEGRGHNWWCVLYPSLCWPGGMPERPEFHSTIWNWLTRLFGGDRP